MLAKVDEKVEFVVVEKSFEKLSNCVEASRVHVSLNVDLIFGLLEKLLPRENKVVDSLARESVERGNLVVLKKTFELLVVIDGENFFIRGRC